jgi:hypothetical protein
MVEHQFESRVGELTELPTGPDLARALHDIDPATAAPHDLPALLAAARRQLSADEARFAAVARELALADVGEPGGRGEFDEFSADEVRAVLSISRTAAWTLLHRADDTTHRLPELGAAWAEGVIDQDRVRTFCTWTEALSQDHARRVVEVVLPDAPRMTQQALITRIRQVATALDPEWARKLYENSVRQRRVRARQTEAGTANLSGLDLPLDDTARAVARVNALAAKIKASGHPALIDTIRADVFLALLSPEYAGAEDRTVINALLAAASPDDPQDRDIADPAQAPPKQSWPDIDPDDALSDDVAPPPPNDGGADDTGADDDAPLPGDDGAVDDLPAPDDVPDVPFESEQTRRRKGPRQARIELRVGLATLLGLDARPGVLPGWGVVHAELARQVARDHSVGEWRVAVTDAAGVLSAALLTRHRPHGYRTTPGEHPDPNGRFVARPVVEIHAGEEFLDRLDPAAHPGWARLITDLQYQLVVWRHARDQATAGTGDPAARRAALARFPSAALARWVEMRDRGCIFPSCGAHAIACDLDHTLAWFAEHGLTVAGNLDPMCGHDHDAKHRGGWRLEQPRPGRFVWTSPTGHRYEVPPRSALPDLPEPRPPADGQGSNTAPSGYADNSAVWATDPYPVVPETSRPPPPPATPDDPPPF